uniref:Nucleoprotein n=1 Tax=Porcine epidemic diarrhea virus TaxID=28295 RepID=A0A8F6UB59_PEDV|nr:N protein [Porcine epidemic diarrhea virus]
MASVSFQDRGRKRVPLSLYAPLRVTNDKPLSQVLANNAVPTNKGNKDQQIGYWNEQIRWRMRRGERIEQPSNWHFYYLGTGPHADLRYRTRTEGVFWVAKEGAKTEPTNLGVRKASEKPIIPNFSQQLPSVVEIVEPNTPPTSRANSRSRSRGNGNNRSRSPSNNRGNNQSRGNSQNRGNNQGRGASQNRGGNNNNNNKSRNQSKNRNQSNDRGGVTSRDDLVAAVKDALKSLGIGENPDKLKQQQKPKQERSDSSGKNTPKKNKSRATSKERDLKDIPEWRRIPKGENSVAACFGPRGGFKNFGDAEFVEKGVDASGYAQIASLAPNVAALLFGGNVAVRELADSYEITYNYKMTVPKSDPNVELLVSQVDAFKTGNAKPQRKKEKKNKRETTQQLNEDAIYDDVGLSSDSTHANLEWDTAVDGGDTAVEIINEIFDTGN